jgi:FtsH-binding integral membrane protein
MTWAAFFIQVVPLTALASLASVAGIGLFANRVTEGLQLPIAVLGLLLFLALITFRETSTWNFVLLLTFALIAGTFLGGTFSEEVQFSWGVALLTALGVLFLTAAVGGYFGERIGRWSVALWIGSWVYLLGWVIIAFANLPPSAQTIWAFAGLIIFGGLSTSWFASLMSSEAKASTVSLAIDLFILVINLLVAARVMLGSIS